jgi:hypothetical protein
MANWPTLESATPATQGIIGPPFAWCWVRGGRVTLEDATDSGGTRGGEYQVPDFAISKYPVTNAQYQQSQRLRFRCAFVLGASGIIGGKGEAFAGWALIGGNLRGPLLGASCLAHRTSLLLTANAPYAFGRLRHASPGL